MEEIIYKLLSSLCIGSNYIPNYNIALTCAKLQRSFARYGLEGNTKEIV
jgi:hypothetical protein